MESNMVTNEKLNPFESTSLVEDYFKKHFENFIQLKKAQYTGYWAIEYSNGLDIRICFDGDISGHFSIKIFIDKSENHLWQFDRSVNNATESNQKNILYQLDILKLFLSDRN